MILLILKDMIDFMGFHQQKLDHHLIIMRLYINKTKTTYLYCLLTICYSMTKIHTITFYWRCLNRNKIIGAYIYVLSTSMKTVGKTDVYLPLLMMTGILSTTGNVNL